MFILLGLINCWLAFSAGMYFSVFDDEDFEDWKLRLLAALILGAVAVLTIIGFVSLVVVVV